MPLEEGAALPRTWLGVAEVPSSLRDHLSQQAEEVLPLPPDQPWEAPGSGELVLLSPGGGSGDPFVLCSRLKRPERPGVRLISGQVS